jgi:trigger factor
MLGNCAARVLVDGCEQAGFVERLSVNVSVEHLGPCKKLLRIEVDAAAVDAKFDDITREFQRHAQLPGFRPGKAPRDMIVRLFAKRIEEEVLKKLVPEAVKQALQQEGLRAVTQPEAELETLARGQPFKLVVTAETAPQFDLPEYKGLPARREIALVSDADIARALDVLREQRAKFADVVRPVQEGDYVVVNYSATCDGKPLREIAPTAHGLGTKKNFWVHVGKDAFLPGFAEQLLGAQAGEQRTVTVTFPTPFVTPELGGKQAVYAVDIVQVKERRLPEPDDAFAQSWKAKDLQTLREGVRADLERELAHKQDTSIRNQLVQQLLDRVQCELPESFVNAETKNVVYDIVRENQQRGVSTEAIEKSKDRIYNVAANSAKDRVKAGFVLHRIAEKEGLKASEEEISQRVLFLAQQYQVEPRKFIKQLQERDGISEIADQIITSKVIDLLVQHARIEEVPAASAAGA